jgi:KDO2-lipid IV(A) lauroyltransferase
LARCLGFAIHRLLPRKLTRYEVARANLRQAFGTQISDREIDRIIQGMWVHLFRLLSEIANLPHKLRLENVLEVIEFRRKPEVVRALFAGRPVIFLGGHFGNWEMAISVFGQFGFPMGVIARDLENPLLQQWFLDFRQSTGHMLISKKGCFDDIVQTLEQGGRIALLADQDAGRGGIFVDFFGRPASTPKTIALMALQYDALILVGYARRLAEPARWVRFELGCEDIIDPREVESADPIREITQRYTTALERLVRRAPEQYFWVHKRWKSAPGEKKLRRQERKKAA